jgi:hypothetical protein
MCKGTGRGNGERERERERERDFLGEKKEAKNEESQSSLVDLAISLFLVRYAWKKEQETVTLTRE